MKDSIPFKEWKELYEEELETLYITLRPKRLPRQYSCIAVGAIYHPPKPIYPNHVMVSHIINSVDHILRAHPNAAIFIMGDLNQLPDHRLKSALNLKQIVTQPTRGNSILDKVYTNASEFFKTVVIEPIASSDHRTVLCLPDVTNLPTHSMTEKKVRTSGHNEKTLLASELLHIRWEPLYHLPTCNEQFEFFMEKISELLDTYLPVKTVRKHNTDKPWITEQFKSLIQSRQWALNNDRGQYKQLRNKVNRMNKSLRSTFYKRKVENLKQSEPRQWWKHVQNLMGQGRSHSNPLQSLANEACDGDLQEMATKINKFFQSVSNDLTPLSAQDTTDCTLQVPAEYIISVQEVERRLSHININKSTGPDEIPNWLLRDFASILANPITAIYNSSIREGYIPQIWKSADVSALPKKKPPRAIESDLRPISLTPILSKELEYFPSKWLWNLVKDKMDSNQYGGIPGSSPVHALVDLYHHWLEALDSRQRQYIRVLFLDYAKAFDHIDHNILLNKLASYGIPDFLLQWIRGFLTVRQQRVRMGQDLFSDWLHIHGGVPQGTRLGPILFVIMINDLKTICPTYKYVDDTTIYEVCKPNTTSNLQEAVDTALIWSTENNMKLNPKKTHEMVIDFGKARAQPRPLQIAGSNIETVSQSKLLGIIISND